MSMKGRNQKLRHNQQGMVALVTTFVLMIVISLILVGFSQTVRREQRQTLDYQLSAQAFYAADSGVNIGKQALERDPDLVKTGCAENAGLSNADTPPNPFSGTYAIDGSNVAITCLLLKPPTSHEFDQVGMNSITGVLKNQNPAEPIDRVFVSWQASSAVPSGVCGLAIGSLPQMGAYPANCNPMLRIDLSYLNTAAPVGGTGLWYPVNNTPFNDGAGNVITINCSTTNVPYRCIARIDTAAGFTDPLAYRIMSLYGNSDISIWAENATGNKVTLIGGQMVVDVTARASDVVKRVEARVQPSSDVPPPDYGIFSGDNQGICKQYRISQNTNVLPPASPSACDIP